MICCLKQPKADRFSESMLRVRGQSTKTRTLVSWPYNPSSTDQNMMLLQKAKQNKTKKAFLLCTSKALSTHHCCIVLLILHQSSHNYVVMPGSSPNSKKATGERLLHPYNFHSPEPQTDYLIFHSKAWVKIKIKVFSDMN